MVATVHRMHLPHPSNATSYETSGVMRCCIQSLMEWVNENPYVKDGQEVLCHYETNDKILSGYVLRGNIWRVRLFDDETKRRLSL